MTDQRYNILIIGNLHSHPSSQVFLQKFSGLVHQFAHELYIIGGDYVQQTSNVHQLCPYKRFSKFDIYHFVVSQIVTLIYILKNLKEFKKIDIVIVLGNAILIAGLFKIMKKPIILYRGGSPYLALQSRLKKRLYYIFVEKCLLELANVIVVESNASIEFQKLEGYRDKVIVLSQYVEDVFFNKIFKKSKTLAYIGSFTYIKGVDILINAFGCLVPKLKKMGFKFIFYGDGEYKEEIKKYAEQYKIVISTEKWIPHSVLPRVFETLGFIILPSRGEGIPNIVLEGMASCVVPIATAVGGIVEILEDQVNGYIVMNLDEKTLCHTILDAISTDPKSLLKMRYNGYKKVFSEFRVEAAIHRYKKLFNIVSNVKTQK
ncbi:glycosyltransferase family 4 protein [Thermococcus sp. Bubb.Bath]|uniref:glycosyltransferase family 4 protein n=1 Tax=Thermococcus sp. Bubb.Bath TaxID=1638242 RepID=UPI001439B5E3|nr:glycosyltransferase family 4 protein [Thermococcus sp. Bubb.Bath]NJF25156.1 glycosyltransferase [Thermococcus sp. Bubb.Bath]